MLLSLTFWFDFFALSLSLWMAFYLLGRGFPSHITLRGVLILLALAGFFLSATFNIFNQVAGTAALRAVLLVLVLTTWYDLTLHLLPERFQKKRQVFTTAFYVFQLAVVLILLFSKNAFVAEQGNGLWVAHMGISLPFILYGISQVWAIAGILINLLSEPQIGLTTQGRYFLLASILPALGVGYGILSLIFPNPMPRMIQDTLIFAGVFMMGYSVARHQTLVERRTSLQDFPISGLGLLGLSGGYALLAWMLGFPPEFVTVTMAAAIITHSLYDLVREFLERQRYKHESSFRRQLRQLDNLEITPDNLTASLQDGLKLLCQAVDAAGGWIAIRQGEEFSVTVSYQSLTPGSLLPLQPTSSDDLFQPADPQMTSTAWIAPALTGDRQVALVGICAPKVKLRYSPDNLDLLAEAADRIGIIVSLANSQPNKQEQFQQLVSEAQSEAIHLRQNTDALLETLSSNPDPRVIGMVEEALRHLSDYITLGQLPLADWANIGGANHIERGRNLQKHLIDSIESLHPTGARPKGILPREWYSYVVLYDAYVECVTNREIMARLYISEGTFNRTRRNALRGLARLLVEKR